jgi:hypothetical protein
MNNNNNKSNKYKYIKYKSKYLKRVKEIKESSMGQDLPVESIEDQIRDPYDNLSGPLNIEEELHTMDLSISSSELTSEGDNVFYKIKKLENFKEVDFTDKLKPDIFSILSIKTVDMFDKFTNKYGKVINNISISIDWEKVSDDFNGVYLSQDQDTNLKFTRFDKALYNNKEYESWWEDVWKTDDVITFPESDIIHTQGALFP